MSIECGECEHDLRGGHASDCFRGQSALARAALMDVRHAIERYEAKAKREQERLNNRARPLHWSSPEATLAIGHFQGAMFLSRLKTALRRIEKKHSKRPKGET